MANKITIWGANGSGKSVLSLALAVRLSKENANVVVLSLDKTSPMFSTFLPYDDFSSEKSLGSLLNNSITMENLDGKLHLHKENQHIAFLTLGDGDSDQRYGNGFNKLKLEQLVLMIENFADYIIFDTTSNFIKDNFTLYALQNSHKVFSVYNSENKTTAFFNTYLGLLENTDSHIKILSNVYDYSPADLYVKEYGIQYVLPHSKDIYLNFITAKGDILKVYDKEGKKFTKELEKIVKENLIV